jgi:tRNA-splicing ligase RtcB (3'-phosphate/5'-hydroxy nucleic acid ligase)
MDYTLRETPLAYAIWGKEHIDEGSLKQMDAALSLPVSTAGALMPDAHIGYGLPIGGVLATDGVVIPYAVGVDIACRMRMSVFEISPHVLGQQTGKFENALTENTLFGAGKGFSRYDRVEHPVLDDAAWRATGFLATLKDKADEQLGTSGSGNHFAEWGAFTLDADDLGLKAGTYLALLSHSGSRGVGYAIADRFSKLAQEQHPALDKSVRHLAWLDLDSSLGYEYWISMQLAGQFAAANHEVIHQKVAKAAGLKPAAVIENHHNFAWKETHTGADGIERDVIVHRKGATPAGPGVLGIIPGSMGDPGFVVRGKGNASALNSAAHGAGRLMSRRAAKQSITQNAQKDYLKERGVTLIGGDLDEAPQAYKDIHAVMEAQADLVDVVGKFEPRIVRMDGSKRKKGKKKNRR